MNYENEIKPFIDSLLQSYFLDEYKKLDTLYKTQNDKYINIYEDFFSNSKTKLFFKEFKKKYSLITSREEKIIIEEKNKEIYDNFHSIEDFENVLNKKLFFKHNNNFFDNLFYEEIFLLGIKKYFLNKDILHFFGKKGKNYEHENVKKISTIIGSGYFGNIVQLNEKNIMIKIFLKNNQEKENIFHEEFVGKMIFNRTLKEHKIPNLVYTFCSLFSSEKYKTSNLKEEDIKTENILNSFFYLIPHESIIFIEKIIDSLTLKEFFKVYKNDITLKIFKDIYYQILLTIHFLFKKFKYCHNDLHCENIMIKKNNLKNLFPLTYYKEKDFSYVYEEIPEIIPVIIDVAASSFIDGDTGIYYGPNIKEYFIMNQNNDIYKFTLSCLKYIMKYDLKEKTDIKNFLSDILVKYFMKKKDLEETIKDKEKMYHMIFKRFLTIQSDDSSVIITEILKKFKKKNNSSLALKKTVSDEDNNDNDNVIKSVYESKKFLFLKYANNFYLYSFVKDISTKEFFEYFLKNKYNRNKIVNDYDTPSFKQKALDEDKEAFLTAFSTIEKIKYNSNEDQLNILEDILKDYQNELGNIFDKEKFGEWYKKNETNESLYFYIIKTDFDNVIGYIGFKTPQHYKSSYIFGKNSSSNKSFPDNSFLVEIYLKKELLGKGIGELIYYKGINELMKELNNKTNITIFSSIFKNNFKSINFFVKKLDFKLFYDGHKDVAVFYKKNDF